MFMHDVHPELLPREAIPQFFLMHSPAWLAGAAYAIILLSVVMTGAALTLSIATILNRDVLQRYSTRFGEETRKLAVSRLMILAVIGISYAIVCWDDRGQILHWAFLAMTLRGVTIFFPVIFYLLRISPVQSKWAVAAIWGAPIFSLVWSGWLLPITGIDPLVISGFWSALALLIGWWLVRKEPRQNDIRFRNGKDHRDGDHDEQPDHGNSQRLVDHVRQNALTEEDDIFLPFYLGHNSTYQGGKGGRFDPAAC
uniref:Predicted protein n=1 Tax=Physcomitrium patens TaxID=3218 RepID=A9U7K8_PHYPA